MGGDGEKAEARTDVARSILAELEILLDRTPDAVGHRGTDPESRARRQAMAGTLAALVQAEALLQPAVERQAATGAD